MKVTNFNNYNLHIHQHRFASWCASTASRTSPNCRFTVETGVKIIEQSSLSKIFIGYESLPSNQDEFNNLHTSVCNNILSISKDYSHELKGKKGKFTYGIAAKLLNCYLNLVEENSKDKNKNKNRFEEIVKITKAARKDLEVQEEIPADMMPEFDKKINDISSKAEEFSKVKKIFRSKAEKIRIIKEYDAYGDNKSSWLRETHNLTPAYIYLEKTT